MPPLRAAAVVATMATVLLAGCTSTPTPGTTGSTGPLQATGLAAVIGKDAAALYTDKPLGGGQDTPAHVFLAQSDGRFLFYHLNNDDVNQATGVLFVGDAFPGRMCLGAGGVTPEQYDAGYVHFHLKSAPNWDAGHNNGGDYATGPQAQGYWFRHLGAATQSFQMMGQTMQETKGQAFPMIPADKAKLLPCPAGLGPSTQTLGQQLAAFYNDHPLGGGQDTPAHLFLTGPDGKFLFLHFDNDDVAKANGLLFVGDAFPGKMCAGGGGVTKEQFDAGYVHFHLKSAPNWDAGHNNGGNYQTGPQAQGYWFRHLGAFTGSMQMMGQTMQVTKDQVFPLMPADFAKLLPC